MSVDSDTHNKNKDTQDTSNTGLSSVPGTASSDGSVETVTTLSSSGQTVNQVQQFEVVDDSEKKKRLRELGLNCVSPGLPSIKIDDKTYNSLKDIVKEQYQLIKDKGIGAKTNVASNNSNANDGEDEGVDDVEEDEEEDVEEEDGDVECVKNDQTKQKESGSGTNRVDEIMDGSNEGDIVEIQKPQSAVKKISNGTPDNSDSVSPSSSTPLKSTFYNTISNHKSLKRKKIPPPLNITHASSNGNINNNNADSLSSAKGKKLNKVGKPTSTAKAIVRYAGYTPKTATVSTNSNNPLYGNNNRNNNNNNNNNAASYAASMMGMGMGVQQPPLTGLYPSQLYPFQNPQTTLSATINDATYSATIESAKNITSRTGERSREGFNSKNTNKKKGKEVTYDIPKQAQQVQQQLQPGTPYPMFPFNTMQQYSPYATSAQMPFPLYPQNFHQYPYLMPSHLGLGQPPMSTTMAAASMGSYPILYNNVGYPTLQNSAYFTPMNPMQPPFGSEGEKASEEQEEEKELEEAEEEEEEEEEEEKEEEEDCVTENEQDQDGEEPADKSNTGTDNDLEAQPQQKEEQSGLKSSSTNSFAQNGFPGSLMQAETVHGHVQVLEDKFEFEFETSAEELQGKNKEEICYLNKKKFLKICEKIWDESYWLLQKRLQYSNPTPTGLQEHHTIVQTTTAATTTTTKIPPPGPFVNENSVNGKIRKPSSPSASGKASYEIKGFKSLTKKNYKNVTKPMIPPRSFSSLSASSSSSSSSYLYSTSTPDAVNNSSKPQPLQENNRQESKGNSEEENAEEIEKENRPMEN